MIIYLELESEEVQSGRHEINIFAVWHHYGISHKDAFLKACAHNSFSLLRIWVILFPVRRTPRLTQLDYILQYRNCFSGLIAETTCMPFVFLRRQVLLQLTHEWQFIIAHFSGVVSKPSTQGRLTHWSHPDLGIKLKASERGRSHSISRIERLSFAFGYFQLRFNSILQMETTNSALV